MTVACHYAIVRFLPFVETGEFANVGIVLFSPTARFFGFRLMKTRHARVTNFFDQLDGKIFRSVMRQAQAELQRLAQELKPIGTDRRLRALDREAAFALWSELTKPLASVLRVSEPRVAMAADPQAKLQELFAYYVERNFVTKEYQEEILVRSVRGVLRGLGISEKYQHMRIGDDEYNAAFPLVAATEDDQLIQVIKPLNLAHVEPTKIRDHGAAWLHKVSTLKLRGFLPDEVLIAVNGSMDDTKQGTARRQIVEEFEKLDVAVSPVSDTGQVREFATKLLKHLPTLARVSTASILDLSDRAQSAQPLLEPPTKNRH